MRFREPRRCVREVLAIVENEEEFLASDGPGHGFSGNPSAPILIPRAEATTDGTRAGSDNEAEFDQPAVAPKRRKKAASNLQRQHTLAESRPVQSA